MRIQSGNYLMIKKNFQSPSLYAMGSRFKFTCPLPCLPISRNGLKFWSSLRFVLFLLKIRFYQLTVTKNFSWEEESLKDVLMLMLSTLLIHRMQKILISPAMSFRLSGLSRACESASFRFCAVQNCFCNIFDRIILGFGELSSGRKPGESKKCASLVITHLVQDLFRATNIHYSFSP